MNARFHVRVEPAAFELAYPDVFMDAHDFGRYVGRAMDAYLTKNSIDTDVTKFIISQLKASTSI